ncbi:olfactory receptor 2AG2-like [Alligator sinensis]|uniref:Olfactory receptor n=1 Tax=Alligator sinensis TaxID=38654 RepID=A0A1U8DZ78_ALLSI|nr:olfactory receptor 2AG2-like [Alligator sinensis]
METHNTTSPMQFILLGFLHHTNEHTFFLALIWLALVTAVSRNTLLLVLIQVDSSLHTPMHFFLSQLAFMDMCQTLTVVPKMSADCMTPGNRISPVGCGVQIFLSLTMGGAECLLLAVMAYDRYVAICNPLQYPILLRRRVCWGLAAGVWVGAAADALMHSVYTIHLSYCGSKDIEQFFCEIQSLLKLSCSDTSQYETLVIVVAIVVLLMPASIILASYTCILSMVPRMKSTKGKQKALATCSSHLTVVGLFYGSGAFMYMRPSDSHSPEQDKFTPVFYIIVTPVLNPLIYSLRNRDVLGALRKLVGKYRVLQQN